ncbi:MULTISPECIES: hypothetical protein [unclassified Clostridium]|uniref:hypothetical protein n=1 Tax=unclassified Clostridium TaxID=2614128 RepID=UPI002A7F58D2|nr:hypothetical protein [Clostridium sp.]MCI6693197.1 hypothetical protein [Clostridium sp.]MDY4251719.1 hypothetical protein [Clostridium sp.]MDY6229120.1 hypothetical protein [Clostridium sp.]
MSIFLQLCIKVHLLYIKNFSGDFIKRQKKQLRDDKIFLEELSSNIVDAYQGFAKSVINLNVAESHTLRASILEQLGRAEEVKMN